MISIRQAALSLDSKYTSPEHSLSRGSQDWVLARPLRSPRASEPDASTHRSRWMPAGDGQRVFLIDPNEAIGSQ